MSQPNYPNAVMLSPYLLLIHGTYYVSPRLLKLPSVVLAKFFLRNFQNLLLNIIFLFWIFHLHWFFYSLMLCRQGKKKKNKKKPDTLNSKYLINILGCTHFSLITTTVKLEENFKHKILNNVSPAILFLKFLHLTELLTKFFTVFCLRSKHEQCYHNTVQS